MLAALEWAEGELAGSHRWPDGAVLKIVRDAIRTAREDTNDGWPTESWERMSTEAQELHRIISASVRDMLDAYRLQAQAGPVTDKAVEQIVFRAAHGVLQSLSPYPAAQRAAMLPNVVRLLLAAFLEDVAGADSSPHKKNEERK